MAELTTTSLDDKLHDDEDDKGSTASLTATCDSMSKFNI